MPDLYADIRIKNYNLFISLTYEEIYLGCN